MIYDPFSPTREVKQDDIFRWYHAISVYLGHEPDSHNITQLRGIFSDDWLIEVWIAIFGSSRVQWHYGHWKRTRDNLISIYGATLIPYLEKRTVNPFHGGGTAYGATYLAKSKQLTQEFCSSALGELKGCLSA